MVSNMIVPYRTSLKDSMFCKMFIGDVYRSLLGGILNILAFPRRNWAPTSCNQNISSQLLLRKFHYQCMMNIMFEKFNMK